jgi:omega-6 fatty acid desaturase (delta-12 desaturase)
LFYAQHNFPGIDVQPRQSWSYVAAALGSSSYMRMGRLMKFVTGNIGFHHVHHLNPSIPFYRLPAAMHAIPELQTPHTTSLSLRDVRACLSLKLWDPQRSVMVGFPALTAVRS